MNHARLSLGLGLPVVAALLLSACGVAPTPATATVSKGDLAQTVHAAASTVNSSQAKLGFKAGGRIAKMAVAAGDQVQEGQVLAQLDTSDLDVAVRQAQAARDVAAAAVAGAQAKVQQLLASAKSENIAQAAAGADIARQKLADMLAGGRPEQVAQAQAQVDAAQAKLQQVQSGSRQEQVQQAQAALDAATAKLQALQDGPRPEQVAVLQKQVDAARNTLQAAQATRDGQCNPRNPDYLCSAGQAQVNAAQTALDGAQKQFELATAPPTATDLQAAQAGVTQARAQLALLQDGGTAQDVQVAQAALTQAQQALVLAKRPYTGAQIQQARDAVTQADAAVSLAQHPFTDADLAVAQAAVQQAQAALEQADAAVSAAQTNLAFATLKAPSAGRVLQVNNVAGEIVSPGSIVLLLGVGPTVVNASLPEAAAGKVQAGQAADVRFDSLPGQPASGKVTDIAPAASTNQSLVTYLASIALDKPLDAIHVGMTADVTIYTARKQGVLLVPNQALQSYQGKQIVSVVGSDGQAKVTDVQTGLSDAQNSEVLSGLSDGQRVLLAGPLLAGAPGGAN